MIEIIWHGRGGQGAFTAARLLGAAATLSGERFALAFPSFGPERRGAPMRAFTKISESPIGDRSAVEKADFVIYLDGTLLPSNWKDEVKEGGLCFMNATEAAGVEGIIAVNADSIASELLGRPIPNTVFLGALAAAGCIDRASIEQAVRDYMPQKLHASNLAVIERSIEVVTELLPQATADTAPASATRSTGQDASTHTRSAHAQPEHICTLRDTIPAVEKFAESTCYEAGYLTQINAGWRNIRPVFNAALCTGCLQCYMTCPDGTLYKVPAANKAGVGVGIDLDFCKGCGICANACKSGALLMVSEAAAQAAEKSTALAAEKTPGADGRSTKEEQAR